MSDPGAHRSTPFPRAILAPDSHAAAGRLLGALLIRGSGPKARRGRIVEVEAYVGHDDLASHARFGCTKRNAVMFGPPGVAYVYLVYGMHHCLNVVTEPDGMPAALLVRAVEPIAGVDEMRAARLRFAAERSRARIEVMPAARLAAGPALVCAAFSIDRADDGVDLCDATSELRLEIAADDDPPIVQTGPRIGIDYAPEPWRGRPWRYFVPGSAALSVPPRSPDGRRVARG
jgi:DNA-3-methyladenine glycosylase